MNLLDELERLHKEAPVLLGARDERDRNEYWIEKKHYDIELDEFGSNWMVVAGANAELYSQLVHSTLAALPALLAVARAAQGVDHIYGGSFHGEAVLLNVTCGVAAHTGPPFDALRAALAQLEGA